MSREFDRLRYVVPMVAALSMGTFANAQTVPHFESARGQVIFVQDPDPNTGLGGQMDFIAEGRGTHLGRYTQTGGHSFDAFGNLFGEFESTAADGSTTSGIYFGTFEDVGQGLFRFEVTAVCLLGTGRLKDVTGMGDVVAILDGATGQVRYRTEATWTRIRRR